MLKIGEVVHYHTTEKERNLMKDSTTCNQQEILPAIVVAVWSETTINASVVLDGKMSHSGLLWKTSILEGTAEGNWSLPSEME